MGRTPCCEKEGLRRGRWTAEEDDILIKYIQNNGEGSWRSLPKNAGLLRCGKSCRLRWINYLRGDLKRGNITTDEEEIIVKLHGSLGNRWSVIASQLPGRTDNEIKNYWNTHLSRKIYQFFRSKNDSTLNLISKTDVVQANPRLGRVSRCMAKKYNKNRVNIKSPPVLTSNTSALQTVHVEITNHHGNGSYSVQVKKNVTDQEDKVGGIEWDLEDKREDQNLGLTELCFPDDEIVDLSRFSGSGAMGMDSGGVLSIHGEDQTGDILADMSVEFAKMTEIEDEFWSSSEAVGFVGDERDDMLLWLWDDEEIEPHHHC